MVDFNKKYRSLVEAFIVCFIAQESYDYVIENDIYGIPEDIEVIE